MVGIQHTIFATAAADDTVTVTWPPSGTDILTVVYGTAGLYGGSPPPEADTLTITNTSGSDAAYAYLNVTPDDAVTSTQVMSQPVQTGSTGLAGLYCRATLQATPTVLQNGYRLDYFNPTLRLIRFDSGSATVLATRDLTGYDSGYYTNPANAITYHLVDDGAGNDMTGWLSAPGRLDTLTVTSTGANTTSHASGRIGFLMFQNLPGAGTGVFDSYDAEWT